MQKTQVKESSTAGVLIKDAATRPIVAICDSQASRKAGSPSPIIVLGGFITEIFAILYTPKQK
jgi:hypothetical protein